MRPSKRLKRPDENVIVTTTAKEYHDDLAAGFEIAVEEDKDFISGLPTEILHNILSYLILDHDPERGVKMNANPTKAYKFKEQPHVFLSLSTMTKHLCAVVESFCLHHLTVHGDFYQIDMTPQLDQELRRSARLAVKPKQDPHVYRMELVKRLMTRCIHCGYWSSPSRAIMASGVACCPPTWSRLEHRTRSCEEEALGKIVVSCSNFSSSLCSHRTHPIEAQSTTPFHRTQ
jgi:hypothetical protein